jgi:hypothetical protein
MRVLTDKDPSELVSGSGSDGRSDTIVVEHRSRGSSSLKLEASVSPCITTLDRTLVRLLEANRIGREIESIYTTSEFEESTGAESTTGSEGELISTTLVSVVGGKGV